MNTIKINLRINAEYYGRLECIAVNEANTVANVARRIIENHLKNGGNAPNGAVTEPCSHGERILAKLQEIAESIIPVVEEAKKTQARREKARQLMAEARAAIVSQHDECKEDEKGEREEMPPTPPKGEKEEKAEEATTSSSACAREETGFAKILDHTKPPTLDEVLDYCHRRKWPSELDSLVKEWHETNTFQGWTLPNGEPMRNWKVNLVKWRNRRKVFEKLCDPDRIPDARAKGEETFSGKRQRGDNWIGTPKENIQNVF